MSVGSDMKIIQMQNEGKPVPDGWMIDKDGVPSNTASDYLAGGTLLPFGGYKGYGLALMVETFAATLSGAAMTKDVHAWNSNPEKCGNTGHLFIAVDIEKLMDKNTFNERMESMLDGIKSTPLADGATKIYYPGEIEKDKMAACLEAGVVDVDDDTMAAFETCEAELGLK